MKLLKCYQICVYDLVFKTFRTISRHSFIVTHTLTHLFRFVVYSSRIVECLLTVDSI